MKDPEKSRFTSGHILVLIMAAGLLIRVVAAASRSMIELDETAYVRMAENLAAGKGLSDITGLTATHFSPLLPLLIAGVAAVVRNYVLAGYIVVVVFGTLLLLPTYLLGKELVNQKVGLAAAALVAVMPLMVDYSSRIYTESVYIFFLLLAVVFGRHMLMGCRIPCGTLAGASLGLAYLTNPSAVFYLVALLFLAVAVGLKRGIWRQLLKSVFFFLVFFLIYATPYVLFLHAELGKWTYSGKVPGNVYASTHNLRAGTLDWEKDLLGLTDDNQEVHALRLEGEDDPMTSILKHPVRGARIFLKQSFIFYSEVLAKVLPLWLLPLLGLGLFARGWSRRRAAAVGYLLIMMAPALLILSMYAHDRFFMPFIPMVAVWVGEGWLGLNNWANETADITFWGKNRSRWRRGLIVLISAAVLLPLLVNTAVVVGKQNYPVVYKEAGLFIKQEAGEGKRIMSREFSAAYYSGGTDVVLPYADYDRVTAYAYNKQVDYLVISLQELKDWRPCLERLADDSQPHPEWRLVHRVFPGTDRETLIVQLVKPGSNS